MRSKTAAVISFAKQNFRSVFEYINATRTRIRKMEIDERVCYGFVCSVYKVSRQQIVLVRRILHNNRVVLGVCISVVHYFLFIDNTMVLEGCAGSAEAENMSRPKYSAITLKPSLPAALS